MPIGEYIRWCAFFKIRSEGGQPQGGSKAGTIDKFRKKLAKQGFYNQTGYRR